MEIITTGSKAEVYGYIADRPLHAKYGVCIQRLKANANMAGQLVEQMETKIEAYKKELEESRTGTFFGAYNATENEVAMYSGPRFIELVRALASHSGYGAISSYCVDIAYTLMHMGLQFTPDGTHSPFGKVGVSKEFDLAWELVAYLTQSNSPPPMWFPTSLLTV